MAKLTPDLVQALREGFQGAEAKDYRTSTRWEAWSLGQHLRTLVGQGDVSAVAAVEKARGSVWTINGVRVRFDYTTNLWKLA